MAGLAASVANSCASLDFPMPAGPRIVTRCGVRSASRAFERLPELGELERAADERRLQRPDGRPFAREVAKSPGTSRCGLDRLRPGPSPDELLGVITEQDLLSTGGVLELLRSRHGFTNDRHRARAGAARQNLACRDCEAGVRPRVGRIAGQRVTSLERSRDGPERVVLVDPRDPEDGHHLVATATCDGSPVALNGQRELGSVALLLSC